MAHIERIGFEAKRHNTQTNYSKKHNKTNINISKKDIILGSLATIGIVGMADVFLAKGKHLNKLTGKNQEINNALLNEKNAKAKIAELEKQLNNLPEEIIENNITKNKERFNLLKELKGYNIDNTPSGLKILSALQEISYNDKGEISKYIEKMLNAMGYEFAEFDSKEAKTMIKYFENNKASGIKEPTTIKRAVRRIDDGKIILNGHVLFPM